MDPGQPVQNSSVVASIDRHIECAKCGYDLCGLDRNTECPECGEPVENSLAGRWLRFADRQWLNRVVRGLRIEERARRSLMWSFFALLALMLLGVPLASGQDSTAERVLEIVAAGVWVLIIQCAVVMGVGMWRAMAPEPIVQHEERVLCIMLQSSVALVIPAFGLMAAAGHISQSVLWQQIIVHACFMVIAISMFAMVHLADDLESRCIRRAGRSVSARQIPAAAILALVALAIYWWGPIRTSRSGAWVLPSPKSAGNMVVILGLIWFALASRFRLTLDSVRAEVDPAKPMSSSHGASSRVT